MKGQISRHSNRPQEDFSALLHQQGRVITDADLNESALITQGAREDLGNDAIRDGAPEVGGCIAITTAGVGETAVHEPALNEGIVYADGVRGVVRSSDPTFGLADGPLALYDVQRDLPDAPPLPGDGEHLVYADVWHRPVFPFEDAALMDVALQGADTAFRTRTMAQIKTAPFDGGTLQEIASGRGPFPKVGNATLTASPLTDLQTNETCDPCAREIPIDARIGNALFRLEVIAIEGTVDDPVAITLAWSIENASEVARLAVDVPLPDGFVDQDHAYEHLSIATECHRGAFADPASAARPVLLDAPDPSLGAPFVRRWDGACRFPLNGPHDDVIGSGAVKVDGRTIEVGVEVFSVTLSIPDDDPVVIPGDYWLVELREFSNFGDGVDERIHVVSETPIGIVHAYTPLFRIVDGDPVPLSDIERRRVTFPPLSDIPASNVSFETRCNNDLYGDAENAQEAFDRLCRINARHIAFDDPCSDTFGGADTVAEALEALCGIGDRDDKLWRRLVFDWGVICGLKVVLTKDGTVQISPGAYLTYTGNFAVAPWEDVVTVKPEGGIELDPDWKEAPNKLCLGIEKGGDGSRLVIGHRQTFPRDNFSFRSALEECANKPAASAEAAMEDLSDKEKAAVHKAYSIAVSGTSNAAEWIATEEERLAVEAFAQAVVKQAEAVEGPAEAAAVIAAIDEAKARHPHDDLPESLGKGKVRGEQATAVVVEIVKVSMTARDACRCFAIWPPCPDRKEKSERVPLSRITLSEDGTFVTRVCMGECRKQALTPRTIAYYMREQITRIIADGLDQRFPDGDETPADLRDRIRKTCCPGEKESTPDDDIFKRPKNRKIKGAKPADLDEFEVVVAGDDTRVAIEKLTGNGIGIAETIAVAEQAGIDRMAEIIAGDNLDERIVQKELVKPGDTVALLIDSAGRSAGYLVTERGPGRYSFPVADVPAPKPGAAEIDRPLGDLDSLAAGVNKLTGEIETAGSALEILLEERASASAAIAGATDELSSLSNAIATAQTELGELTGERTAVAGAISAAEGELATLRSAVTAERSTLSELRDELAELRDEQGELRENLRRERPLSAIPQLNGELMRQLARAGVFTVGELADPAPRMVEAMKEAGINQQRADLLTQAAAEFLRR